VSRSSAVDVLVLGGGTAGAAAAISAARRGARTQLVERHSCLGGIGTAVLDTFYGAYAARTPFKVVGGLFDSVTASLDDAGEMMVRPNRHGGGIGIAYNADVLKVVWERMAGEAGVGLLYNALFVAHEPTPDGHVAIVATKAGLERISARILIDATGDGDFCAAAGAKAIADEGSGVTNQTLTTVMRVSGVDGECFEALPRDEVKRRVAEARLSGYYAVPHETAVFLPTLAPGVYIALATRISGIDPLDPRSMTGAEIEGRRQALEFLRLFKDRIVGFANARLLSFAAQVGVRESRRIDGDYRLTEEDVLAARKFPDVIAQSGSPIEEQHGAGVRWEFIPGDGVYDIPYRCLLPRSLENVLVAGRCLSATHFAHASCRLMAQCMAMGEAAGTAAALAIAASSTPRALDPVLLQEAVLAGGAVLFDRQHVEFNGRSA
jgi:hypothetical protein